MAKKRNGTPRSADSVLGIPSLELVLGILDRIPGTHSFAVSYKFGEGDYLAGTALRVEPKDFTRSEDFALALLSCSLFRKYPGLPGSEDKAGKAIEKWHECEVTCGISNERIKRFRIGQVRPDLHDPFRIARKKIQKLLGEFSWGKAAKHFDFGPGSTTRLPFSKRHPSFKYGESPETTFDNLASAVAVIGLSPVWTLSSGGRYTDGPQPCVKIREESKITTVPKDAFIDRVIAIEPDMNMFVQKGFGGYIRRRLKWVGVDLDDQTLNQTLARSASLGGLATIDLSSASDTICYELVKELLPPDWFEALLSCRTHASRLPSGEVVDLQKFSAMGNGFTFELESLIFWALCSSVCSKSIGREGLRAAVYGDDIIVNVEDFDAVVDILTFCGFSVNERKTFASGPYRESCGKHYFYGRDVTPITVTKEITHVSQLLLLCNNLVRFSCRLGNSFYRDSSIHEAYRWAVARLPTHFQRPRIPDGYGDGALIGSFDEVLPQRCRKEWDGWRTSGVLLPKPVYRGSTGVATLAACLSRLERSQAPRDKFDRFLFPHQEGHGSSSRMLRDNRWLSAVFKASLKLFASEVDDRPTFMLGSTPVGPASIPLGTRVRLGKVFIKQWYDIGPWI